MLKSLLSSMAIWCLVLFGSQHASAYNLRHISGKDGLTSSSVLSLAQKPDGTMLFGTVDGLHRYDGTQVWNYTLNFGQYIKGNVIEDILSMNDRETWVLTNYGLNIITGEGQHVEFYDQFQGLRTIRCNTLGQAFLLGEGALYYQGADRKFQKIPLPGIDHEDVRDYAFTKDDLFVFHQKGISRYSMRGGKGGYSVGKEFRIDDGQIMSADGLTNAEYLVDEAGTLHRFDLKTGFKRQLASLSDLIAQRGSVSGIVEFKGKLLVSFFNHGVIELDLQAGNALPEDIGIEAGVMRMTKDSYEDIVWIATDGQGVYMCCDEPFSLRTFTYSEMPIGLSCPIRTIMLDHTGTLWIGTKGDGLVATPHFDFTKTNLRSPKYYLNRNNSGLSSNVVYALVERGNATGRSVSRNAQGFWICGAEGLDYYSQVTKTIVSVKTDVPLRHVVAAQESGGELWMATLGYGIYKADITTDGSQPRLTNIRNYVLDHGKLSSNYFFCLTHDSLGNWWFGNRGKGLFMLDKGQLKHIQPDEAYTNPCINDVFSLLPVGDHLWVGCGCGIIISDKNGRSRLVDISQGLPGNTIHALVRGAGENIWATTNAGVVALSSEGQILRVYGRKSGLDVTEYSDGAVACHGNELYFGGINGLVVIRQHKQVRYSERHSQMAFTTLLVNGIQQNIYEYLSGDSDHRILTLGYQQNSFRLGVASLDYLSEPFTNYYYRLSSGDEWYDNGQDNMLSFMHLPPGQHTLFIKYKNMATGSESGIFKLAVVITPPWYRSRWALLCYSLLFGCLAFWLFRRWRSRLKEKQAAELVRLNQIQRDELYEEKLKFLTNVVHELNTPLTLIYGPCERILAHEADNQFVKKYIRQIERNLKKLNWLIQEVIDFRRITTGHHVIAIRRVDMSSLADGISEAFLEMADRYQITYQRQIAEGLVWNSDPKALARILSNLISNAFKYTRKGGRIEVSLSMEDGHITISVYNTGAGISETDQKRIFDYYSVFNHTGESLHGEQTSNGIGMAICHNMVRLLGGSISIDSRVGEYARFVVKLPPLELPVGTPADQKPVTSENAFNLNQEVSSLGSGQNHDPVPSIHQSKHLTGEKAPTILVIDDNQEIIDLLADALQDYHLLTAHNGDEGLGRLKDEQPDLIITDLMIPGTDGLDFIQQVKQDRHTMHIPLIILSAKSSEDERIEGLESGADAYINKPFSIAYLRAVANRLIENRNELKDYYNSGASAHSYVFGKLVSNADQEFIDSLVQLMDSHLNDVDFTAEKLANLQGISLRNLYRKFESAQLPTPKEYIRIYRINAAARMLTTTSMTVQDIIYRTGFNTRSQFYTEFKKLFGVTPVEYRRQRQSNE